MRGSGGVGGGGRPGGTKGTSKQIVRGAHARKTRIFIRIHEYRKKLRTKSSKRKKNQIPANHSASLWQPIASGKSAANHARRGVFLSSQLSIVLI